MTRLLSLGAGETEALALALDRQGVMVLTDDAAARLAADGLGVEAHGTVGVITRAIRRRQRSREQVLATLRALPSQSTLHLSRELLDSVIRQVAAEPEP